MIAVSSPTVVVCDRCAESRLETGLRRARAGATIVVHGRAARQLRRANSTADDYGRCTVGRRGPWNRSDDRCTRRRGVGSGHPRSGSGFVAMDGCAFERSFLGRLPAICWSFDAGMRCDEVCNCRRHLGAKPHVWNGEDALVLTSKQGPPAPTLHIGSVVIGEAQSIRLSVVQNDRPMLGVAQIAGVWSEISPGVYEQRPFVFSMSGKWRARVLVRPRTAAVAAATFAVNAREQALARKESLRLRGQCLHT